MSEDFIKWLAEELQNRGWSQSEAARRGGISASMINAIMNRQTNPGLDFCKGIARAFGLPLDEVFRRAGILPAVGELPEGWFELGVRVMALSPDQRPAVLQGLQNFLRLAEGSLSAARRSRA